MKIEIDIDDNELLKDEKELISKNLKLNQESDFDHALRDLCKTAAIEYLKMLTDKTGLPTKRDELLERRIVLLIKHYYSNRIPNESEIQSIFKENPSKSRKLLIDTIAHYEDQIQKQLRNSLLSVVKSAENLDEHGGILTITSDAILKHLNNLIKDAEPGSKPITKKKGSSGQFDCSKDTYNLICRLLSIEKNE